MSLRFRSVPTPSPNQDTPAKGGTGRSAISGRFANNTGGTTRHTVFPGGHTSVTLKKGLVLPQKDGRRK